MNSFVGIDLGTTGLKVSIVSERGDVTATASREYPILSPRTGWAEQNPREWWDALVAACREIEQKKPGELASVSAVSLCGQMHTQVYLDRSNEVLRPAITWMDQRTVGLVDEFNADPAGARLAMDETQNRLTSTYTAPHLRWVQRNDGETWKRTEKILIAKDYLKFLLTGEMMIDHSEASGTALFNNVTEDWSDAMLDAFSVKRSLLPDTASSPEIIGKVTAEAAKTTGIPVGIPVANGSTDNSAAALGAGMVDPGQVTLIIGTAGVVSVCSDEARPDPQNRTLSWHYCVPGRWINLGVTQTAGESLNWFKEVFDGDKADVTSGDIFADYNQAIADIPAGSGGMIFLPYLNGERTPYWDSSARAVFFGASLSSTKAHFIKAIMEGVSFALRNCIDSVEDLGQKVASVRAVGGGLKSPTWMEALAGIVARPLTTVETSDAGNLGNAMIAGVGTGLFGDFTEAAKAIVREKETVSRKPNPEYEKQYRIFRSLYEQLRPSYKKIFGGTDE